MSPTTNPVGAHASSLYKQAKIKMESLSREAAGRQASQPGTRGHLQQLLEAASRDGRLAAAVARCAGRVGASLRWA